MRTCTKAAAVDNDFVNHLVDCKLKDEELLATIATILSDLKLSTVMHPLVYEKELILKNARVDLLFERQIIYKTEFSEILQSDHGRNDYYTYLVGFLYEKLMGKPFPVDGNDVLTYWKYGENLGEIHSVSMCAVCGYGIFLSDDGHSKHLQKILKDNTTNSIEVYNRQELVEKHLQEGENTIPRDKRRKIIHSLN